MYILTLALNDHVMKKYGGAKVSLQAFVTSALDEIIRPIHILAKLCTRISPSDTQ
jgi:hypothetical protein